MTENHAIIGILMIVAISAAAYLVVNGGSTGAAVNANYVACCCHRLTDDGQVFVRSQVQTFADNCRVACSSRGDTRVFAQDGLCEHV
ncbi:hypothetical protein J4211_01395 [Candidatus Woesearchaeota archaeon]|nr:hypothetical protein [uncultured archaeon]AQS33861.1 hypothetical protein [uncultured archaeon]MBS3124891.1 hypothetical protein [Candidatus Woesearchaeota archaeon]